MFSGCLFDQTPVDLLGGGAGDQAQFVVQNALKGAVLLESGVPVAQGGVSCHKGHVAIFGQRVGLNQELQRLQGVTVATGDRVQLCQLAQHVQVLVAESGAGAFHPPVVQPGQQVAPVEGGCGFQAGLAARLRQLTEPMAATARRVSTVRQDAPHSRQISRASGKPPVTP